MPKVPQSLFQYHTLIRLTINEPFHPLIFEIHLSQRSEFFEAGLNIYLADTFFCQFLDSIDKSSLNK